MAAVELTRMDFHVARFMNSDDVDDMDASEVGQFCLLLFKAWLTAKDCTLPVEEEKLARYARVPVVSPLVLKQFPVVDTEWGPRRQNAPQFAVWIDAKTRSEAGKVGAANRWRKADDDAAADTTALPSQVNRKAVGVLIALPNPEHSRPDHTTADQTTAPPACVSVQVQAHGSDWKNIAVPHKRIFGTQASSTFKEKYAEACSTYGEDIVLACFHDWAQDAKDWAKNQAIKQPLFAFWKKLSDMAETAKAVKDAENADAQQAVITAAQQETRAAEIDASIKRQAAADTARFFTPPPPVNEGDPFEYLAEVQKTDTKESN